MLALFAGLALGAVILLPSFEGPDESEHARYVQAFAEGGDVHPVDPDAPRRWGYQVHHPPLYYAIAGGAAPLESILINGKEPRVPPLETRESFPA